MTATERQQFILDKLKEAKGPITGSQFAKMTNVSRQVIVQDISILKAKRNPSLQQVKGISF